MGKKRTRNAARSRKALLEAAERLFAERGYHGTSMEQVARRAGLSKAMVFLYFGTKDTLLFAIVEQRFEMANRVYSSMVKPGISARDQLAEFTRLEKWLRGEITRFGRTMIGMWSSLSPQLRRRLAVFIKRNYVALRRRMAELFREFLGAKRVDGVSVEALATVFMSCLDGLLIRRRIISLTPSEDEIGRAMRLVFITLLADRKARPGKRKKKERR
jgi:AcrR family transcriptional regulator